MKRWFNRTVVFMAIVLCYSGVKAAVQPSVERYLQSGSTTEAYNLDGSGNVRVAGWQATAGSMTVVGAMGVTGATSLTGAVTTAGSVTSSGLLVYPPVNMTISSATVILPSSAYITLLSSGSTLTLTGKPTISTTTVVGAFQGVGGAVNLADGMVVTLSSTDTTKILLQDNATLSGSLLVLEGTNATTEVVTSSHPAVFQFNATVGKWVQTNHNAGAF